MRTRTMLAPAVAVAAAGAAATWFGTRVLRPWMHRGGATDEDLERTLPGDELSPDAVCVSTRAVTIEAPAERIWPWLCQIGQQRGGFYSYRWLENLVGCEMPRVERLVPGWDRREVGEKVWMTTPEHYGGKAYQVVAVAEPRHALVLVSGDDGYGDAPGSGSWAFVLQAVDGDTTRLLVRSRYASPNLAFELAHFVMERKMLLTIKRLAEATPLPAPGADVARETRSPQQGV